MTALLVRILDFLQTGFPLHWFGVSETRVRGFRDSAWRMLPGAEGGCVWFHASSLGELEMLRPLMDDFLDRGQKVGVSVFSDSALSGLLELAGRCVYAGLSPNEAAWGELFLHFQVRKLILAKYDLWPGMIRSAGSLRIPVLVINARVRKSFRLMQCLFLFQRLPEFHLFGSSPIENGVVSGIPIRKGMDPRWERVCRRMESASRETSPRVVVWKERIARLPRPIWMIGSAWPEDLEWLLPALRGAVGGVVVVPHSLAPSNLERIQTLLSPIPEERVLVIPEMGILVELYAEADFAFVGGGFGKGIHSLIEPASYGIPVASGPVGVSKFPEAKELSDAGVYSTLGSDSERMGWFHDSAGRTRDSRFLSEKRAQYRALLEECLRIR